MGTGRIFINYRRDDSRADSGRIYDHLIARFPGKVFRDVGSLEPGVDWQQAIGRVIGQSDACVVVIGCGWLDIKGEDGNRRLDNPQDTVRREIFAALQRNIRIFPVLVGGAKMPRVQDLPADLQPLCDRNALELNEQDWDDCCARLVRGLEVALGVPEPAPVPQQAPKQQSSGGMKWVVAIGSCVLVLIGLVAISLNKKQETPVMQPLVKTSQPEQLIEAGPKPNAQQPARKDFPSPVGAADGASPGQDAQSEMSPARPGNEDLAGTWSLQANLNSAIYNETMEMYRDHSFRVVMNGSSQAVGRWQSGPGGELDLTNGTNLVTFLHFTCTTRPSDGSDGYEGNCVGAMNYAFTVSFSRLGGAPRDPVIPSRVNVASLSLGERAAFGQYLSMQRCTCGCGMSVYMCLQKDLTCNVSPRIAQNALGMFLRTVRG